MIAIDTNIVVRIVVDDDKPAVARARALLERSTVFVPHSVLVETEWVLRSAYGFPREQIAVALRGFLGLPNVEVRDKGRLAEALEWWSSGMDLADALHLAASADCESFATFDRRFIRTSASLKTRPPVSAP